MENQLHSPIKNSKQTMIEGVKITNLKIMSDERGKVMHMLREDSDLFIRFGEIYFSLTHPGVVKAWYLHRRMTLNYAVIHGEIQLVIYDDRESSSTRGRLQEIYVSPENYNLVTIPPLLWYGFKCIGRHDGIIANCSTLPHDPSEINRKSPSDPYIPYDWRAPH